MSEQHEYLLGTDEAELRRLGFQHQVWAAESAMAWERAGFAPGMDILDLGSGPGYASFDLARLVAPGGRVTAVDVSARFIAHVQGQIATQGVGNLSAEVQDIESLGLPPGSFDGAWARWVLCFVRRPEAVVESAARALRRGGRLVVQDYSYYEGLQLAPTHPAMQLVVEAIVHSWRESGGDPDIGARLPALMQEAGLRVESVVPVARIARPGSALWQWPRTFFDNYLP